MEKEIYRLNEPMTWKEFLAMPDEYRIAYIEALRRKYNVPDKHICRMMGEQSGSFSLQMQRLRIRSTRKSNTIWDKEGFYAWVNGHAQKAEQAEESCVDQTEIAQGTLCLVGTAKAVFDVLKHILGSKSMKITISWEAV